jgi:hypothetical protein
MTSQAHQGERRSRMLLNGFCQMHANAQRNGTMGRLPAARGFPLDRARCEHSRPPGACADRRAQHKCGRARSDRCNSPRRRASDPLTLEFLSKLLRLDEPMCSTLNTAAFESDGKLGTIRSSAATPLCRPDGNDPIAAHLVQAPSVRRVGIAVAAAIMACPLLRQDSPREYTNSCR